MQEKAAIAAQKAGGNISKQQQIQQKVMGGRGGAGGGRGGAGGGGGGRGGAGGGGPVNPAGSKQQWLQLIKLLQEGGREASGGLGVVDFGVGTSANVLSKAAREEKKSRDVPYESLPAAMKAQISKKDYEKQAKDVRGSEAEPEKNANGLLPVVVFSFSKKKCEEIADYIKGQDYLHATEKALVAQMHSAIMQRLNPDDADLPQIHRVFELLRRGIGVHHGGLLPILKETVELLFAQSVVKVLLATETFAMGVNFPARVVVFNGFKKHDGREFRELLSGEYIQMAGRAGRRGLDAFGTVIIACWVPDPPPEPTLKRLLTGLPTVLASKFRLRYNMILNLVRVNNLSVSDMIKASFTEFASQKMLSIHNVVAQLSRYEQYLRYLEDREAVERETDAENEGEEQALSAQETERWLQSVHDRLSQAQDLFFQQLTHLVQSRKLDLSRTLEAGRIAYIAADTFAASFHGPADLRHIGPCFGVILLDPAASMQVKQRKAGLQTSSGKTAASVVAAPAPNSAAAMRNKLIATATGATSSSETSAKVNEKLATVWVLLALTHKHCSCPAEADVSESLSSSTVDLDSPNVRYGSGSASPHLRYLLVEVSIRDIVFVLNTQLPLPSKQEMASGTWQLSDLCDAAFLSTTCNMEALTPRDLLLDLGESRGELKDIDFVGRHARLQALWRDLSPQISRLEGVSQLPRRFSSLMQRHKIQRKVQLMQRCISDESLSLFPDFQQRLGILGLLGYLDKTSQTITTKGRVACEMNSCEELLGTEMLFHNVLEPLNPPEAAAMLSALVFQEKTENVDALTSRMEVARSQMQTIYEQILQLQELEGIETDPDAKPALNFGLCAVTYQWARGVAFKDIMSMSEVQEGTIVRAITRLDELCRDVAKAAVVMGNPSLYRKMEAASACIKRDIVFAASLYITADD